MKRLSGSQLSLLYTESNRKFKQKIAKINRRARYVQSSLMIREGSPGGTRSLLRWEAFVKKVGFEPGVKE